MCKAIDVANFFISLSKNEDNPDNMKLNKLLFFAQGHSLALLEKPLFQEKIQAWKFGPIVPNIYHTFKICGKNPICDVVGNFSSDVFSQEQIELLFDVAREYDKYTGTYLSNLTHKQGTPWQQTFNGEHDVEIPQELICAYFKNIPLNRFSYEPAQDEIVGLFDEKEYTVLPKELDDGEY